MANITNVQTLVDGNRNVVVKVVGILDTSNLSDVVIADPATLTDYDINGVKATQLRIDHIEYDIQDGLTATLYWDADTPVPAWTGLNRGEVEAKKYGGLLNNAGDGKNGKITLSTTGWSSGTLSFTIVVQMVKQ